MSLAFSMLLDTVSTTCGSGWVGDCLLNLDACRPTRYRRWY